MIDTSVPCSSSLHITSSSALCVGTWVLVYQTKGLKSTASSFVCPIPVSPFLSPFLPFSLSLFHDQVKHIGMLIPKVFLSSWRRPGHLLQNHRITCPQQKKSPLPPKQNLQSLTHKSTQTQNPNWPAWLQAPCQTWTLLHHLLPVQLQWRPAAPLQPPCQQTARQRQTALLKARRRKAFSPKARSCSKSWDPARKTDSEYLRHTESTFLSSLLVSVGSLRG